MIVAFTVLSVLLVLVLIFLLCLKGRKGRMAHLRRWRFAHRGLHNAQRPENSMSAFRAALEGGYGIELDVHLMKDGNLAILHDANLNRVAGADVRIEDLTLEDLEKFRLGGTEEKIPLFSQVLELFQGTNAPLIVELKSEQGNYARLSAAACEMLDRYDVQYCMESFDPRCVLWLRRHRPEIIRGQLVMNWMKHKLNQPWIMRLAVTCNLTNAITRPDFIAYHYPDRNTFGTGICRKLWGVQGVAWTIHTRQELETAEKEGWIPIFESFTP